MQSIIENCSPKHLKLRHDADGVGDAADELLKVAVGLLADAREAPHEGEKEGDGRQQCPNLRAARSSHPAAVAAAATTTTATWVRG